MNNTRDIIIEKSFLLFLRNGYKAVKLSDIERSVGITKGTFYYHFQNKEEVLKEAVTRYYDMLNKRRSEETVNIHSLRDLVDLTIHNLMEIHNYSAKTFSSDIPEILCLSLMVEVIAMYPEFKNVVTDTKDSWLKKLENVICESKLQGEITKNVDSLTLAKNLLNISVGLINDMVLKKDITLSLKSIQNQYEQFYSLVCVK